MVNKIRTKLATSILIYRRPCLCGIPWLRDRLRPRRLRGSADHHRLLYVYILHEGRIETKARR